MKYYTQEQKLTLVYWGFDPDKPVTNMSLGELYSLMKLAINRRGETS